MFHRTLLGILITFSFFSAQAQKNRYGMKLTGTAGNYTLTDGEDICKKVDCSTLPADAYIAWKYKAEKINGDDFKDCKTTRYTYHSYNSQNNDLGFTHNLALEVDLPLTEGPHPFIIWVHGGSWTGGSVSMLADHSQYLASRGIAGVRMHYSLVKDGGKFEIGMKELEYAFEFVKKHAKEWKIDMTQFGYAGASAGGPLAGLRAMQHSGCKLFLGYNGMYDFSIMGLGGESAKYFSSYPKAERGKISAINFIPEKDIPAVAVYHGTGDITVDCKQSRNFADALLKKKAKVGKNIYDYYGHGFFRNKNTDMYEPILIDSYEFAKSVFTILLPSSINNQSTTGDFSYHVQDKKLIVEGIVDSSVVIHSLQGLKIAEALQTTDRTEFYLPDNGLYLLTFAHEGIRQTHKIILNKK